jgi:hypothetical protein
MHAEYAPCNCAPTEHSPSVRSFHNDASSILIGQAPVNRKGPKSQGERKVQKTGRMRYLTIPGDRVLAVENWDGTTPRYLSIALLRDFAFALPQIQAGKTCFEAPKEA